MFLKIGEYRIARDRITHIDPTDTGVIVCFGHEDFLTLRGSEADALLTFVDLETIDLLPVNRDDSDFAEYRTKGGTLIRSSWDSTRRQLRSVCDVKNPSEDNLNRASQLERKLLL